jgi:uncharacterized protein (TIGR02300 family)
MPAKDLGTKHTCFKCSTKFYDLKKLPAICPKCGADQKDTPVVKPPTASEKRARAAAARSVAPVPAEGDEADTEVIADEDDVETDAEADDDEGEDDDEF